MNLILYKLGNTDIQFLNRPKALNIGIRYEFRPVGRYYSFYPLTCNAAFRVDGVATEVAALCESRRSIRTKTVRSAQLP